MGLQAPLFSMVLIAKNEEKTLPRFIASIEEFRKRGGEIIIVDTGSTDKTVAVARSFGCIVAEAGDQFSVLIDEDLCGTLTREYLDDSEAADTSGWVEAGTRFFNFSEARNFAASLAHHDMVGMPDCDEAYTRMDIDHINQRILNGVDRFNYSYIFAHTQGRPLLKFSHSKFYNRRKYRWNNFVHEILKETNAQENPDAASAGSERKVVEERLDENILLLEHFQNQETDRGQYLAGLAYDCWKNKNINDRNSHYLGRELMYKGKYRSAIKELTRHTGMKGWVPEQARSMLFIGDCWQYLGDVEKMKHAYQKSFDMYASRDPLLAMARFYHQQNDHQRTASYAEAALAVARPAELLYFSLETDYTYYPHELLYWAYWYLGAREKSRYHFNKCLEFSPDHPKFLKDKIFFEQS
jgi:glycosyltransferase involved in cell wall biosynthesis